jgi:hypothetical protein
VRIGNAAANPKEDTTMKKLTTKLMIATAALMAAAGSASAQTLRANIPFEFRAGDRVMAPGTYSLDYSRLGGIQVFRLSNVHSGGTIALLPQAPVDPQKGWSEGDPKLAFACVGGSCALAEIWTGSESHAYTFHRSKLGGDVTADLREIPLQRNKSE